MKKIIHLDNSDFFRKIVKTFLSEQGFLVESFRHGSDALNALNEGDVGLVVTGLSFSDMEGSDFIQRAVGFPHNIPIIALTSTQDTDTEQALYKMGIKAFVLKSGTWQEQLMPLVMQYFSAD
ncbi:MAG: response regulator [Spirochaetaceae bacterium]|jgi:two-component system cell cycle response regulator|nr:response regulator [Spirochaetaceae bacterium]